VQGKPIEILASGGPWFNPLHITDAVELTVQALTLDQSVTVNIAGQELTTFAQIATMAARHVGREPLFQEVADEAAIPYYRANLIAATERMNQLFSKPTPISLLQGVTELAEHYTNVDRTKPV